MDDRVGRGDESGAAEQAGAEGKSAVEDSGARHAGWAALRLAGHLRVPRFAPRRTKARAGERARALSRAPEGTRSADGTLGAFKDGAFSLAIRAGAPVLPVAIAGTRQMRPKHSKWFGEAHACAKILAPIATEKMAEPDVPALRERARASIADALPDLRARFG